MAWSIFVLFILLGQGFGKNCPLNQNVERMDTGTIYCMIDGNVQKYYWYKGSVSHTQPILRLEKGVKGGEKYDDDHYDITSGGNMKIINAKLEHEAIYTFAVIFENGTTWRRSISVLITVTPSPPCPIVQSCRSCDECTVTFKSKDPTTLTCYIEEVRPNVTLYWSVKGDNVTYTETASSEINNNTSDTWNISTTILFDLICAENITFYCSVFYDHKIMTIGNTTVQVRSESCNEDNTKPISPSMKVILLIALGILTLISLALLFACCLCHKLHRRRSGRKGMLMKEVKQNTLLGKLTDISSINSYCSDCQYTITYTNNGISHVNNADELIAALFKGERANRVLFVGEPGIGKSHLFRDISRKWRKGEIFKDYILIYFQLENVPKDACILEELMKLLGRKKSAAEANRIIYDLQRKKSIVMLDGISNWSRLHNNATNDGKGKRLTIKQVLEGDVAEFSKMNIWVTSRKLDHDMKVTNTPYTRVEVVGFTESHRSLFFERYRQLKESKQNDKEKQKHVRLERKRREGKGNEFDPEERPLNVKHSEDISSSWQTHMEAIRTDGCSDYLARSPLIARLFASIYLSNCNEDNKPLADYLFRFITEKKQTTLTLIESGNCDLLACLLEVGTNGEEEYQKYVRKLHMKKVLFRHMTDEYYLEAVLHLLKTCKETKITIDSLEIHGDFPIVQLSNFPDIYQRLVFHGVKLAEKEQFKAVIRTFQQMKIKIEFHNSKVPERLSEDELQDIGYFEVLRKNESDTFERLSEDGEWTKITTTTSQV
ncbi:uncharacterized protein [Apostichopus japonicus]|uniref:uncharacterized protein n=1 Tax=Stichopus japonicus TaxID=307972 RepID=UPI003AB36FCB